MEADQAYITDFGIARSGAATAGHRGLDGTGTTGHLHLRGPHGVRPELTATAWVEGERGTSRDRA